MKAKWGGELERFHQMLSSSRQIVKARDERKDKMVNTITQLCLLYEEGRKVSASAQAAEALEFSRKVTKLEGKHGEKELQLQTPPGSA